MDLPPCAQSLITYFWSIGLSEKVEFYIVRAHSAIPLCFEVPFSLVNNTVLACLCLENSTNWNSSIRNNSFVIFSDHRSSMNSMMRNFGDPFGMINHHSLEAPRDSRGRGQQRQQRQRDDMLMPMPHMDIFSHMDSMFSNMHRNFVSIWYLKKHQICQNTSD